MNEDSLEIFKGLKRDFRGLDRIPKRGPVLFLSWHNPKGPLFYSGIPFLINEAVSRARKGEEVGWIGSTRLRLPCQKDGFKLAKKFWKKITEDCYGGFYAEYEGDNSEIVWSVIKVLKSGGMVGLMPDDVDETIFPPRKIERMKPDSLRLIGVLTKRIPNLSIIAAVPAYFEERKTLALDFIPISETPASIEDWERLIKEILTTPVSPENEKG